MDGGTICNSPSLYAFEIASSLRDKENIRVLSIGTGTGKEDDDDVTNPKNYRNDISKLSLYFDFSYKIETAAANEILNKTMGENFSRLETYTTAAGNAYEDKWFAIFK